MLFWKIADSKASFHSDIIRSIRAACSSTIGISSQIIPKVLATRPRSRFVGRILASSIPLIGTVRVHRKYMGIYDGSGLLTTIETRPHGLRGKIHAVATIISKTPKILIVELVTTFCCVLTGIGVSVCCSILTAIGTSVVCCCHGRHSILLRLCDRTSLFRVHFSFNIRQSGRNIKVAETFIFSIEPVVICDVRN